MTTEDLVKKQKPLGIVIGDNEPRYGPIVSYEQYIADVLMNNCNSNLLVHRYRSNDRCYRYIDSYCGCTTEVYTKDGL